MVGSKAPTSDVNLNLSLCKADKESRAPILITLFPLSELSAAPWLRRLFFLALLSPKLSDNFDIVVGFVDIIILFVATELQTNESTGFS